MRLVQEKDERFYIGESTQHGAGRGLFAAVDISRGENLEIIGVEVDRGSVADECTSYADAYKFAADYSDSYSRHLIPMGYGGIVNHANEREDQNVQIKYLKRKDGVIAVYSFIRDVKKDEEVLGDYGDEWRKRVEEEEREWGGFLDLGLYNLGDLIRHA
jgi:hypothetical protein